jgi:hypothetical protein
LRLQPRTGNLIRSSRSSLINVDLSFAFGLFGLGCKFG